MMDKNKFSTFPATLTPPGSRFISIYKVNLKGKNIKKIFSYI